jgi:hypothetical protein
MFAESQVVSKISVERLSDLAPKHFKSVVPAWRGWLFVGLDANLYTLVAAPFVAQLLHGASISPLVRGSAMTIGRIAAATGTGFFGFFSPK